MHAEESTISGVRARQRCNDRWARSPKDHAASHMSTHETYLGDGLYASWDGWQVKLPATGVLKDATGAIFQRQMTAIIFVVLDAAEKRVDDLPAPIADLAEHDHVYATLLVRDDGISLKLSDSSFDRVH